MAHTSKTPSDPTAEEQGCGKVLVEHAEVTDKGVMGLIKWKIEIDSTPKNDSLGQSITSQIFELPGFNNIGHTKWQLRFHPYGCTKDSKALSMFVVKYCSPDTPCQLSFSVLTMKENGKVLEAFSRDGGQPKVNAPEKSAHGVPIG